MTAGGRMSEHDPDDFPSNSSDDPGFANIVAERLTRPTLLNGLPASTALGLLFGRAAPSRAAGFEEIAHGMGESHHLAAGHHAQVLIRWGDKVLPDAPPFDPSKLTAAAQSKQWGYNNDFLAFLPLPRGSNASDRGLLFANHEFTNAELMWPGIASNAEKLEKLTEEQAAVEQAAHGLSIVEIRREADAWRVVEDSGLNRRFTAATPFRIAGPAAGHPRMRTSGDPSGTEVRGTLNNCAGGLTPWGTVLSGEENINFYFGGDPKKSAEARNLARLGFTDKPRQPWFRFGDRWNVEKEPHEPNRFGWVVEIDPYDPASVPVKHTALGRIKHEGATCAISSDGRVAVYTGDDQRFEYVYKFVTRDRFDATNREANRDLLDHGTLFVARFEADGTCKWLPLVHGTGPLTAANGFNDQGDVLIETRRAADLLGATKMDRPEDIEPDPRTGRVYVVLTNNSQRKPEQVDAANPRAGNKWGQILELIPPDNDHAALEFTWNIFMLAGNPADPAQGARYTGEGSPESWLSSPDNLAFDPKGRLWVVTDGQGDSHGIADSAYAVDMEGAARGMPRLFFNAPRGAEVCGPCFTPDGSTLFLAVQHPGAENGSTFETPSTRWPDFREGVPPRPSVLAITRRDGGHVA